ncbi:hypothetical protein CDAR_24491 [Caerostris darwini]|uniref:Uncharacterized protein n=1 Tax=Caerostris darwini TaxID=1538125 RepID=A0AAV4WD74_9ARAC|nr:hypothetical protein CDAR_24491 [Caerostris darwini]
MVEEASLEVGSQALTVSKIRGKSIFVQQRILMFFRKGITLTVWRIAPIRRSFVFERIEGPGGAEAAGTSALAEGFQRAPKGAVPRRRAIVIHAHHVIQFSLQYFIQK